MKQLEKNLYKYIYDEMVLLLSNIEKYLNGENNNFIDSWSKYGIDEKYKILFGNKNISEEYKKAIVNLLKDNIETMSLTLLRVLEGDLYEAEGYEPPVNLDYYANSHPDWHGGLINVTDLKGEYIQIIQCMKTLFHI